MSAKILNGNAVANWWKEAIKIRIKNSKVTPCLAVVLVGNDPASEVYVRNKNKDCIDCGIKCTTFYLDATESEDEVVSLIKNLGEDPSIHGIIVQLPLPKHINENTVIAAIPSEKDVDCFREINLGSMFKHGRTYKSFIPCTPFGVMYLLQAHNIDVAGKHCVIVGRSNLVGKPLSMLMLAENATVTICHSHTQNLAEITKQADILVSAVGKRNLIAADMVKSGAVVVDVGINRDDNGKLCGDVDFDAVSEVASAITPVPGGIGPMTRAALMYNTLFAYMEQEGLDVNQF